MKDDGKWGTRNNERKSSEMARGGGVDMRNYVQPNVSNYR
jgi:hypothetical protein